jgi:hypothetical protein
VGNREMKNASMNVPTKLPIRRLVSSKTTVAIASSSSPTPVSGSTAPSREGRIRAPTAQKKPEIT